MITSKLTTKSRTTIPRPIRTALGVAPGDELTSVIETNRVILAKAPAGIKGTSPFASFTEWNTPEDEAAFSHL